MMAWQRVRGVLIIGAWLMISPLGISAQQQPGHGPHGGTVSFPVSCSRAAQMQFTRGVVLLHHMTYPKAREAFRQAATTDPRCAMAHWGIAMTLFQPLWPTRPGAADLRLGWDEVRKAGNPPPPTRREQLFIDAAAAFFRNPDSTDYWQRIRHWEQAMARVHEAFPDDLEASAFYALAQLATLPPDQTASPRSAAIADLLLGVYRRNPEHPGAMHYLVHANDAPGRERELLEVTRKYDAAAPDNPHALHMPTHIYVRLGEWEAVVRGNLKAADAALGFPAGDRGQFVWDEFPHAIEYLIYAYLQQGADDKAAAQLSRLHATPRLEPSFKTAFHLASTRARYSLERRAWSEAAELRPREPSTQDWDRYPWAEAVTWFARGLGAARAGGIDRSREAITRLDSLEMAAGRAGENLFARNIQVLRLEVAAWLAHAAGARDSAVRLMRKAVEVERATPKHAVTPGPTLPAAELLGDLLLEQEQSGDAIAAYRQSLESQPNRFNSLLGAARASRVSGDEASARQFYRRLLEVAAGGSRIGVLQEAREFLGSR